MSSFLASLIPPRGAAIMPNFQPAAQSPLCLSTVTERFASFAADYRSAAMRSSWRSRITVMRRPLALLVVLLLLPLPLTSAAGAALNYGERELGVWSALINHGLEATAKTVVLAEQTTGDPAAIARDAATIASIVKQLEVPPSTFADWQRRNTRIDNIDATLKLNISYQVLDAKTRKALFEGVAPGSGWENFFKRFPGAPGLLRLSHVGFDDSLSHALVYVEHECGAECGTGHLFHLHLSAGGDWQVQGGVTVWMVK